MGETALRLVAELERAGNLPKVEPVKEEAPKPRTVRVSRPFGSCRELGPVVREEVRMEPAQSRYGGEIDRGWFVVAGRRVMKNPKIRGSMRGQHRAHAEPCLRCPDHPDHEAHYGAGCCSLHGGQLPCETCLST